KDDFSDRQRARNEAAKRGAKLRPELLKLLKDGEQPAVARVAALGALQAMWNDATTAAVLKLLRDPEPDLRRLAAEALALNVTDKEQPREVHEALVQLLNDPEPSARRAVYLAIGRLGAKGAAEALVSALQF